MPRMRVHPTQHACCCPGTTMGRQAAGQASSRASNAPQLLRNSTPPLRAPEARQALPACHTPEQWLLQDACRDILNILTFSNRSLTREAPTPTKSSTNSEAAQLKKGTPASPATALASRVLPVPVAGAGRGQRGQWGASARTCAAASPSATVRHDCAGALRAGRVPDHTCRCIHPGWPGLPKLAQLPMTHTMTHTMHSSGAALLRACHAPGGPTSRQPLGILAPRAVYLSGFFRKSTTSTSSSLAPSQPCGASRHRGQGQMLSRSCPGACDKELRWRM
jgi:hypothetical protein